MNNYQNYRNLGLYDNYQEDDEDDIVELLHEKAEKNIRQYDEVLLKQLSCSHIEQDKFISRNGNEQMRCKACKLWDSGDTTL